MDIPPDAFTVRREIRFSESDPAGIVFFAEFFRMFNDLFEDWLVKRIGVDFAAQFLSKDRMFPVMHVSADFKEARRIGQTIDLTLLLVRLGRSSIAYDVVGHDSGLDILRASFVNCVASKRTGKSVEIPADMRRRMEGYLEACGGVR